MKIKNIALIINGEGWHSQVLQQAWQKHGVEPILVEAVDLHASLGKNIKVNGGTTHLDQMDLLMVRGIPGGSLEQVIYRMDALHQLENQGAWLINCPAAIEKMVDKYYTLSLLQKAGLKVPDTFVTENTKFTETMFDQLGGDIVIKPLFGSRGVGMVRVNDREILMRVLYAMQTNGFVLYLQKFIPHGNSDIRVLVQNGECIAAMKRVADGWKTNISQGALPEKYLLEEDVKEASLLAAHILNADLCGVDLMRGEDGCLYLIEVNSMPSWQGLQHVIDFDIADRIVDGCLYLYNHRS